MAFLGAQFLCPSRKLFSRAQLRAEHEKTEDQIAAAGLSKKEHQQVMQLVNAHVEKPRRGRPSLLGRGIDDLFPQQRERAAAILGELLGSSIYIAYVRGAISKRMLRSFFFKNFAHPAAAGKLYARTMERLFAMEGRSGLRMVS
jgi:hypothetical protein